MKRLLVAVVAFFAFAGSALAAMPTMEPSLPADIAAWFQLPKETCDQYAEISIVKDVYLWSDRDYSKVVRVTTLNGKKIYHGENIVERAKPDDFYLRFYLKNMQENTWLAYTWHERDQFEVDMLVQLGLTREQFLYCDWKLGER